MKATRTEAHPVAYITPDNRVMHPRCWQDYANAYFIAHSSRLELPERLLYRALGRPCDYCQKEA